MVRFHMAIHKKVANKIIKILVTTKLVRICIKDNEKEDGSDELRA
jgi:hypothetical protein